MTTDADLPIRQAVRALMLDRQDRIVMVKLDIRGWVGWVLPGGGIEEGEDLETALRRELLEETGLDNAFVGPVVCYRRHLGPSIAPGFGGQQETIFMVPCHEHTLAPIFSTEELRAEGIVDMKWFTLAELNAMSETIVPGRLPSLVEQVLEFGGSIDPMVIEVAEKS